MATAFLLLRLLLCQLNPAPLLDTLVAEAVWICAIGLAVVVVVNPVETLAPRLGLATAGFGQRIVCAVVIVAIDFSVVIVTLSISSAV